MNEDTADNDDSMDIFNTSNEADYLHDNVNSPDEGT